MLTEDEQQELIRLADRALAINMAVPILKNSPRDTLFKIHGAGIRIRVLDWEKELYWDSARCASYWNGSVCIWNDDHARYILEELRRLLLLDALTGL